MRISDWSSDVCSSDLKPSAGSRNPEARPPAGPSGDAPFLFASDWFHCIDIAPDLGSVHASLSRPGRLLARRAHASVEQPDEPLCRSEEHTSELQSLMRISYAVFCLKKTKSKQQKL